MKVKLDLGAIGADYVPKETKRKRVLVNDVSPPRIVMQEGIYDEKVVDSNSYESVMNRF